MLPLGHVDGNGVLVKPTIQVHPGSRLRYRCGGQPEQAEFPVSLILGREGLHLTEELTAADGYFPGRLESPGAQGHPLNLLGFFQKLPAEGPSPSPC